MVRARSLGALVAVLWLTALLALSQDAEVVIANAPEIPECDAEVIDAARQFCYFDAAMELWRTDSKGALAICNEHITDVTGRDLCRLDVASHLLGKDIDMVVRVCTTDYMGREDDCFNWVWNNATAVQAVQLYARWKPLRTALGITVALFLLFKISRRLSPAPDPYAEQMRRQAEQSGYYAQSWQMTGRRYY